MKHPFAIKHHPESQGLVELSDLEKQEVSGGLHYSTMMVGEEGGNVTTMMVGEEGGQLTTLALGEEGGVDPML